MTTTTQTSVTRTGSCDGKLSEAYGFGLPHSSRSDAGQRAGRVPLGERLEPVRQRLRAGTKTFETNVIGKRTVKTDLLGDLDGRHDQPEPDAEPGHRVGEQQQERDAGEQRRRARCGPSSRRRGRSASGRQDAARCRRRRTSVRPVRTAERAIGSERNRSMMPLLHVVGHADRRRRRGEDDRLGEDPGHQELAVAFGPRSPGAGSRRRTRTRTAART